MCHLMDKITKYVNILYFFKKTGFTPNKTELPLLCMIVTRKRRTNRQKAYRKTNQKEPKDKISQLTLLVQPLRSEIKGNRSVGKDFQSLFVQGKKLLTYISLQPLGMVTQKSCNLLK